MQIVSQSASLSYSLFPPQLQLTAPRIAGLLTAASPQVEVITERPPTLQEVLRQLGPIRSREAMNAEIADMAMEAMQYLNGLRSRQSLARKQTQ